MLYVDLPCRKSTDRLDCVRSSSYGLAEVSTSTDADDTMSM
jgi:hypothetical protein